MSVIRFNKATIKILIRSMKARFSLYLVLYKQEINLSFFPIWISGDAEICVVGFWSKINAGKKHKAFPILSKSGPKSLFSFIFSLYSYITKFEYINSVEHI